MSDAITFRPFARREIAELRPFAYEGVGGAIIWHALARWSAPSLRDAVRADLRNGQARVRVVRALDAVVFEEHEDEGPVIAVLTEGGRTMVFSGQWLDRLHQKGFPWRRFEIVEAPASGRFLGIRSAGERLAPSVVLPPLAREEARRLRALERRYEEVDVDFDAVRRREF